MPRGLVYEYVFVPALCIKFEVHQKKGDRSEFDASITFDVEAALRHAWQGYSEASHFSLRSATYSPVQLLMTIFFFICLFGCCDL